MVKYSVFLINPQEYNIRGALKGLMNNELDFLLLKDLHDVGKDVPELKIGDKVYLYITGQGVCAKATVMGNIIDISIEVQYKEEAEKFWKGNSFEEACAQCNCKFVPIRLERVAPVIDDRLLCYTDAYLTYNNEMENKQHYIITDEVAAHIDYSLEDLEYEELIAGDTGEDWDNVVE